MVSVEEKDHDSLRFMWTSYFNDEGSKMIVLRLIHVKFRVCSTLFLLNATTNHHMEAHQDVNPTPVNLHVQVYVLDMNLASSDVVSMYRDTHTFWTSI